MEPEVEASGSTEKQEPAAQSIASKVISMGAGAFKRNARADKVDKEAIGTVCFNATVLAPAGYPRPSEALNFCLDKIVNDYKHENKGNTTDDTKSQASLMNSQGIKRLPKSVIGLLDTFIQLMRDPSSGEAGYFTQASPEGPIWKLCYYYSRALIRNPKSITQNGQLGKRCILNATAARSFNDEEFTLTINITCI